MTLEAVAWLTGIVCVLAGGARYVEGRTGSRQAITRFAELQAAQRLHAGTDPSVRSDVPIGKSRRHGDPIDTPWRETSSLQQPMPLGVLRIPRIRLEVPILEGTDENTLNQAVGHIEDTAVPGAAGNSGIAGHRDGFFRGLKDVVVGDSLALETLDRTESYRVESIWIVNPEDLSVLAPTRHRSLTLVTCYPFYLVGPAPKRYIVRAVLRE
jgi:sortase A